MSVKYETTTSENVRHKFEAGLFQVGVKLPEKPDTSRTQPGKWLLRGETRSDRLIEPNDSEFRPQSGEWGRYGVFLGDCLSPVFFPNSGAMYVFERDKLPTSEWINTSSSKYQQLLRQVAEEKGLDLSKISGGVEAESAIAHRYYLYDPKTGIATASTALPLRTIKYMLLTPDYAHKVKKEILPNWLREKVIILQ